MPPNVPFPKTMACFLAISIHHEAALGVFGVRRQVRGLEEPVEANPKTMGVWTTSMNRSIDDNEQSHKTSRKLAKKDETITYSETFSVVVHLPKKNLTPKLLTIHIAGIRGGNFSESLLRIRGKQAGQEWTPLKNWVFLHLVQTRSN